MSNHNYQHGDEVPLDDRGTLIEEFAEAFREHLGEVPVEDHLAMFAVVVRGGPGGEYLWSRGLGMPDFIVLALVRELLERIPALELDFERLDEQAYIEAAQDMADLLSLLEELADGLGDSLRRLLHD